MTITFRKCKENDLNFILELKENCFRWYIEKIYGWDDDVQVEWTKREMIENLEHMDIIQLNGIDIGLFTNYIDERGDICIGMFAINPEYQNKGIGTDILKNILDKNIGKRFYLKTYEENPARYLYERHGFRVYDRTNTHLLMERVL
ncbi:GNAT family N-acetyltransferase [Streptococcus marimammalium]|uniref:GNAT family N-acetyltransferase n=1 Tax=Streptococcus marimammalium TaxID=269666 RepID=UPI0003736F76|nr:GNAT family N-acetyltransferase [Streptococcus marimammalium]